MGVKLASSGGEVRSRYRNRQKPEQAQCVALGKAQGEGALEWGAWPKQQGKLGTETLSCGLTPAVSHRRLSLLYK